METVEKIKQQITENPIIVYMKGSPKLPSCGFSSQVAQVMINCGEQFAFVDILQHPDIRAELPKFANWPTFPQLWIEGELIGGCDIVTEMFQKGELQPMIKAKTMSVIRKGPSKAFLRLSLSILFHQKNWPVPEIRATATPNQS